MHKTDSKKAGLIWKRNWQLYLLLAVPVVYVFIFSYIPIGGIVIAFKDFSARKGIFGSDWVGLNNFIRFFRARDFTKLLTNTLALSIYSLIATFPIPILFALVVNSIRGRRFSKTVQTITALPHFISVVVMVGIVFQVLDSRSGAYGQIMHHLTGDYPDTLFASPSMFRHIYVWSGAWQGFGWGSIIYIAALTGVSPEYHEAAQIDGATRFQRVLYVDLPTILPTIVTMLILNMGGILSVGFEKVLLLQNDLNISASQVISTYSYSIGLASARPDMSYGTAIGLFNSVVNFIMIIFANAVSRKVNETSLW